MAIINLSVMFQREKENKERAKKDNRSVEGINGPAYNSTASDV